MKKHRTFLIGSLLCVLASICLFLISDTVQAKAAKNTVVDQGALPLNETLSDNLPKKTAYTYSFSVSKEGVFALEGDFDIKAVSHSYVSLYNSVGTSVCNSKGNWKENKITGAWNLCMSTYLSPGEYWLRIDNQSALKSRNAYTFSFEFNSSFTAPEDITAKKQLKGDLIRAGYAYYTVDLSGGGTLSFKGDFADGEYVNIVILDSESVRKDSDDKGKKGEGNDWIYKEINHTYTLDFTTVWLPKGTYYIKIENLRGATLAYNIKFSIKIPSTKLKVSEKKLSMKVGKTKNITTQLTPKTTTDKLTWTSTNKKVATVNKSGKITAKGIGKATIIVKTSSGLKKKINVTVTK